MTSDTSGPESSEASGQPAFLQLPEVWQPRDAALEQVFAEIPATAGAPGIHLLWRLLANFPSALVASWPAIAAALDSAPLDQAADELRRASFIAEAAGMPSHKAFRGDLVRAEIDADFRAKIEHFNDLSQVSLSRLLVVAAALRQASHGQSGAGRTPASAGTPRGVAPNVVYVPPLQDGEAPAKAAALLERIRNEHDLPLLDDYYRSLGRIVDYLGAAWNAIRPIVGDPVYLERAARLARSAEAAASALPVAVPIKPWCEALPAGEAALARALLAHFAEVLLPQTLVDVTLIKALTSGPDRATAIDGSVTT